MAWSRFDDGYDTHPKLLALGRGQKGDARRWTWTRIVLFCNRHDSGVVPDGIADVIPAATDSFLDDCERIGLLDRHADGTRRLHDWVLYTAAPIETKLSYFLEANPGASANEAHRAVGGKRDLVLKLFSELAGRPPTGSQEPPPNGSHSVPGNQQGTTSSGSHSVPGNRDVSYAGARARHGPVPSRPEEEPSFPPSEARHAGTDGRTDNHTGDDEPNPLATLNLDHVLKDIPA